MRITLDGSRHISTPALDTNLVNPCHRLRQLERDDYVPARAPVDLVSYRIDCNVLFFMNSHTMSHARGAPCRRD